MQTHDDDAEIYYDQGSEVRLIATLLGRLQNKHVIDVGAERGTLVQALLNAGADAIYAFEPFPANVDTLKATFGERPEVHIFDVALGTTDGERTLHVVEDKSGRHEDAFHSLFAFDETPTLRMVGEIQVQSRSLGSLLAEGTIPAEVGILKIDTERSDYAILQGMGDLAASVVMIEFWDDLPETVGPPVYSVAEVADFLAARGFSNYIVIKRHDQFETLELNNPQTRPGDWGNLVFLHNSVFAALAPVIFETAAAAQTYLVDRAVFFATEAEKRLETIEQTRAASEKAVAEVKQASALFAEEAEKRLTVIESLQQSLKQSTQAAEFFAGEAAQRLAVMEKLQATIDEHEREALEALTAPVVDDATHPIVAVRLAVLEEQELALEAYLDLADEDDDQGPWKWVAPQLGVLFQHEPMPFQVPSHYLHVPNLTAPPLISIVTPSLNSQRFLPDTLKSVLSQRYENLEYIVQDGGSTDATLELLDEYRPQLARIASERDNGMAQAINRGMVHTQGDILAYLNSDDLLLPGTLHFVAGYFADHPEVDVVYGHRVLIDADNMEVGRWVLPPHDDEVLSWADYVPQETLFWRRSIWEKIGGAMDETFRFALDWDLILRFRDAGAVFARLPRFMGAFRVHDEQKTSREIAGVGEDDMMRLRERCVGHTVTYEEIWRNLGPYMRRHKAYHKLYRLGVLRY